MVLFSPTRKMLGALLLLTLASCGTYTYPDEVTVRVSGIEYGLFRPCHSQRFCRWSIAQQTDQIPMTLGARFGVKLKLNANRIGDLQTLDLWTTPPVVLDSEESETSDQNSVFFVSDGEEFFAYYELEQTGELVPGDWTVQIYLIGIGKDRLRKSGDVPPYRILLYEKTFHLYALNPEAGGDET